MTTIQVRRDTSTNWNTTNPTPAAGEPCFETNTGKFKVGNGSTAYKNLPAHVLDTELESSAEECKNAAEGRPVGVNLATKFATEISSFANVWAWIANRVSTGNFTGIHVGDYIPVQISAGTITDGVTSYAITAKTLNAQVAGINTYKNYGAKVDANNSAVVCGNHIDFITSATIGTNIPYNPTDNNNGTADQNNPWLASKLYAILNGVNNYTTNAYQSVPHGYDASSGGVLQLLPSALRDVLKMKSLYLGKKYSASALLTEHSAGHDIWGIGKLWVPTEIEVYGCPIHSAEKAADGKDWNNYGAPVQYPLFAGNNVRRNGTVWWLLSPVGGSSSNACIVSGYGNANGAGCAHTGISAPVCFRI